MQDDIQYPDTPFNLKDSLVLLGRRGSEAHGTFVPTTDPNGIDDRDLMGICMPPKEYILGLKTWETAESIKGVWDIVLYDFRKFVRLLTKQNPNVLGMLWLEQEDYLFLSPIGQALIDNRNLFREAHLAYDSFVGYAHGQLKKMTTGKFQGYMGNKRKSLVEKYGYDCKNAAHAIRLLHMGVEYIDTGNLSVRRSKDECTTLIEIKTGQWLLSEVRQYSDELFAKIGEAYKTTPLPESIDHIAVEKLVVECMEKKLYDR